MGPDGVISPHSSANGLIMSIWRRLGMGSSPYSPVIPLVICLPPRPLTGALMVRRRGGAFWWQISLLPQPPPPTQNAHPSSFLILLPLWRTVRCHKLCCACDPYVIPDLTKAKLRFLKASWHSNDLLCECR